MNKRKDGSISIFQVIYAGWDDIVKCAHGTKYFENGACTTVLVHARHCSTCIVLMKKIQLHESSSLQNFPSFKQESESRAPYKLIACSPLTFI